MLTAEVPPSHVTCERFDSRCFANRGACQAATKECTDAITGDHGFLPCVQRRHPFCALFCRGEACPLLAPVVPINDAVRLGTASAFLFIAFGLVISSLCMRSRRKVGSLLVVLTQMFLTQQTKPFTASPAELHSQISPHFHLTLEQFEKDVPVVPVVPVVFHC
ncbi:MAG: hypothetical protein KVP17_003340 [Porospora cf. gigantea B]|uniref:uncharacterized protein n=1 Tax=Porospora cf. gigantea B TaxID=2853592 RepID=UPI003571B807|nr:MAG: hypothetical protein KVP17_003340 [Porospora cf. gigantea B]